MCCVHFLLFSVLLFYLSPKLVTHISNPFAFCMFVTSDYELAVLLIYLFIASFITLSLTMFP